MTDDRCQLSMSTRWITGAAVKIEIYKNVFSCYIHPIDGATIAIVN